MIMTNAINLRRIIKRLSQGSIDSVQDGDSLGELSRYLHVSRPIETQLKEKMSEIDNVGGGILLLIGSAGDGKSHLISCIKQEGNFTDWYFYNDATASCSPRRTAVDTLKEALIEFKDSAINGTTHKLLLAINLGKLNAFIDDVDVINEYKLIVETVQMIFQDSMNEPNETERIKTILFTSHQIFEFYTDSLENYPVKSIFLSSILDKIVRETTENPFFNAYVEDKKLKANDYHPLIINYELLKNKEIRDCIVKYIIEAIIRYKLMITPREYLDFIYSILYFSDLDSYREKIHFYEALLPSLLFNGGANPIKKSIAYLDPLKNSCTKHDEQLSILFTSHSVPREYLKDKIIPSYICERTNKFYLNNGRDIERTTKFLFRLDHILSYHTESNVYKKFLDIFRGILKNDNLKKRKMFELVEVAIPRNNGSFYSQNNIIPLNMQGGKYKLFARLQMRPSEIISKIKENGSNEFQLHFTLEWNCSGQIVSFSVNYQLFEYIYKLNEGRLAISYDNDKDISFSDFIRKLEDLCNGMQEVIILATDKKEYKLNESFGSILLQE